MIGWRARLGFLLPPGNPTVEPEVVAMAPSGVSAHFQRLVARGTPGAHAGQSERNRMMLDRSAVDHCLDSCASHPARSPPG